MQGELEAVSTLGFSLRIVPPTWPNEEYRFLTTVGNGTRLQIFHQHAGKMDTTVRNSLAIISRIDACAAGVINTMLETPDATSALIGRLLRAIGGGIADLARLQIGLSHQITLHRRDIALWDTKKSATRDIPGTCSSSVKARLWAKNS